MNDAAYKIPGNYYCSTDSAAKTLKNCPVTYAFTLKVEYAIGQSYPRQIFCDYKNNIVVRTYDPYTSSWENTESLLTNTDFERYIQANGNATYLVSPNGNYKLGISNSGEVWINNTRIHPA